MDKNLVFSTFDPRLLTLDLDFWPSTYDPRHSTITQTQAKAKFYYSNDIYSACISPFFKRMFATALGILFIFNQSNFSQTYYFSTWSWKVLKFL